MRQEEDAAAAAAATVSTFRLAFWTLRRRRHTTCKHKQKPRESQRLIHCDRENEKSGRGRAGVRGYVDGTAGWDGAGFAQPRRLD